MEGDTHFDVTRIAARLLFRCPKDLVQLIPFERLFATSDFLERIRPANCIYR